jgi:pyrroline-5-carboxylate reductase
MGMALLNGWLAQGVNPDVVTIVEPRPSAECRQAGVRIVDDPEQVTQTPSLVIMAVKPQILKDVLPRYRQYSEALFLSIAAGKTIAFFREHLGSQARIVRAMPNLPASVGQGITVLYAPPDITESARNLLARLMETVGDVLWIEDEELFHGVTALSGSGPAYLFLLTECLEEAGIALGLPGQMARVLARKTIEGAAELMRRSPLSCQDLRMAVASPKGTTEAALAVLQEPGNGLAQLMGRAIAASARRAQEISRET